MAQQQQVDPVAARLTKAPLAPQMRAQVWDLFQQATNEDDLALKLRDVKIPDNIKADLWDLKASGAAMAEPPVADAPMPSAAPRSKPQAGRDVVTGPIRAGLVKGAVDTMGAAMTGMQRMFPGVRYTPQDRAALQDATRPENAGEQLGYVTEKAAELAVPVSRAARTIPTTAKAGAAFQDVMGAAKNVPIDVTQPGNVALRIYQLSERGGSMPKAVRDFLRRVTDPEKSAMTYEEARDFASNISRLSADEFNRLTPVMRKEVGALRVALNGAVEKAAAAVGKGDTYRKAMRDYRTASQIKDAGETVVKSASRHAPPFIAAWWAAKTLGDLVRGR